MTKDKSGPGSNIAPTAFFILLCQVCPVFFCKNIFRILTDGVKKSL